MKKQEQEDRRYIEDVRATYSPVVPLAEIDRLLAAQGRLEYQRGRDDEREQTAINKIKHRDF